MDPDRIAEIKADRLCQVCGQGHGDDDTVYLVCNGSVEGTSADMDVSDLTILSMDQSVLHKHCAQMSIALCPRLKRIKASGKLIIVTALAKHVQLYSLPDDEEQVGVEGQYATIIGDSIP